MRPILAAFKANEAFQKRMRESGVKDHVPTCVEDVRPVHVAGYIEQLQASRKAPTVKQHLALLF
jgi:hypothetical protein